MKTKIIHLTEKNREEAFKQAGHILLQGGLVAFPTETVYGLGGDALNPEAAERIYRAKGRPSDNPLIVHIADFESLAFLADCVPDMAYALAERFWPGPLTMILKKNRRVPDATTGGLSTVAVRMPAHEDALGLIRASGVFIAAPSANTSGRPSPTAAEHVMEDLEGKIELILDGGPSGIGLESTIVDVTSGEPVILRPGYVTEEMLFRTVGAVKTDPAVLSEIPLQGIRPRAPGMKYKHYAPKADLMILEGESTRVIQEINKRAEAALASGKRAGVLAAEETRAAYRFGTVKSIGTRTDELTISRRLYAVLREFDEENTEVIFAESFRSGPLGPAIMNRLLKAAGYQLLKL